MATIKKSMKVDYFFRELENMDVTSAIQYLIKAKSSMYSTKYLIKEAQMNNDWKKLRINNNYPTTDEIYDMAMTKELSQYCKDRFKEDWEEDYKYFCKESYDRNLAWEYLCSCRFDYRHSDGDMSIIKEVRDYGIFAKWILKFSKAMEIAAENYNIEDWLEENGFRDEEYRDYYSEDEISYNRIDDYDDLPF